MGSSYLGLRNADRTCVVTRVDHTRLAAALRVNPMYTGQGREVRVPLTYLYPDAVRFGWGDHSADSLELATVLLLDAFTDFTVPCETVLKFLEQVVSRLPEGGWTITEGEIQRWYLDRQLPADAVFEDVIDLGREGLQ